MEFYFLQQIQLTNELILLQEGLETYSITILADPVKAGTTSGSGKYLYGTKVEVEAFPTDGWIFKDWKEDSLDISTDSIYSFIASIQELLQPNLKKY